MQCIGATPLDVDLMVHLENIQVKYPHALSRQRALTLLMIRVTIHLGGSTQSAVCTIQIVLVRVALQWPRYYVKTACAVGCFVHPSLSAKAAMCSRKRVHVMADLHVSHSSWRMPFSRNIEEI